MGKFYGLKNTKANRGDLALRDATVVYSLPVLIRLLTCAWRSVIILS